MRLNPDCIRDILLTVESNDFGIHMTLDKLCEKLPNYSRKEIHYCCLKLDQGDLLEVMSLPIMGQPMRDIKTIKDLTFEGHEFLANIKSDNTWNKTKSIAKQVGSYSIYALRDIAGGVISQLVKEHL